MFRAPTLRLVMPAAGVLLSLLLPLSGLAAPPAGGAQPGTRAGKAPEISTILPGTPLSPSQLRLLAAKRAAVPITVSSPPMAMGGEAAGKPADVRTALQSMVAIDPAVLEARRRAKEAEAARAPVATAPHGLGLANALGPIPRPEWIRDLLDRQRAAAGITPVMSAARPSAAAAVPHAPLEGPAVRTGTRGEKQPALSHIETGDKLPSAAELAKHSGEKASGGPR